MFGHLSVRDEERSLVIASGEHFSREMEFLEDQRPRATGSDDGDSLWTSL